MRNMTQKLSIFLLGVVLVFTACKDSGNSGPDGPTPVEAQLAEDIPGSINTLFTPGSEVSDVAGDTSSTGGFTFYDLDSGDIVTDSLSSAWDIGFSQTTIIANSGNGGGILVADSEFDNLTEAPAQGYGASLGGSGTWYNYNPATFGIYADTTKSVVILTPDGNYAKIQVYSYYEGNPDVESPSFLNIGTRPTARFFTFRYSLQTNGTTALAFEEYWTYFDFETGTIVQDEASSQWDIAFQSTTIRANSENGGGLLAANIPFDEFTEAPIEGYAATLGGSGTWYNYTGGQVPVASVLPIDGVTLAFLTGDGNYAKVRILSYYQGNPDITSGTFINPGTRSASRYFTFEYAVQEDGTRFFE
jgi:hypothetical protein